MLVCCVRCFGLDRWCRRTSLKKSASGCSAPRNVSAQQPTASSRFRLSSRLKQFSTAKCVTSRSLVTNKFSLLLYFTNWLTLSLTLSLQCCCTVQVLLEDGMAYVSWVVVVDTMVLLFKTQLFSRLAKLKARLHVFESAEQQRLDVVVQRLRA